jgi:hypothetical protein
MTRRPARLGSQQAATSARLRQQFQMQFVEPPHQRKVCGRYAGAGS